MWVMFAVESGSFRYRIGGESGTVKAGDLIFCPPGQAFQREALSPMSLHFIGFTFETPLPDDDPIPMPTLKSHPTDVKRLASDFSYLRKLYLAVDARSVFRKQNMLNDLWQLACSEWESDPYQDHLAAMAETDDELMNRAADWLRNKAYTRFSMRQLSEFLNLSPVQLTRRFQRAFHMTPTDFVRMLRIRKAAWLLLDTELTLDQIAERCGYENGFYLSRVFRRSMNMSPSQYRDQHRV
jgi:AraC-like DNA-binding protein